MHFPYTTMCMHIFERAFSLYVSSLFLCVPSNSNSWYAAAVRCIFVGDRARLNWALWLKHTRPRQQLWAIPGWTAGRRRKIAAFIAVAGRRQRGVRQSVDKESKGRHRQELLISFSYWAFIFINSSISCTCFGCGSLLQFGQCLWKCVIDSDLWRCFHDINININDWPYVSGNGLGSSVRDHPQLQYRNLVSNKLVGTLLWVAELYNPLPISRPSISPLEEKQYHWKCLKW